MLSILSVVAPVFAIVVLGYCAVRFRLYPADGVRGLLAFVNNFATPVLLFDSMRRADFSTAFNPAVLASFYAGAFLSLFLGSWLSRRLFAKRADASVTSGFSAMFSNSVLLGLPILSRAYGPEAMPTVFSIISLHAPLLLTSGMLYMELSRRGGARLSASLITAARNIALNPLLWGVGLGMAFNFLGVELAEPVEAFTRLMSQAVLPAALFGLGGALLEYKIRENWLEAVMLATLKLAVHPALAFCLMVFVFRLDPQFARYAALLAAMPTGLNAYVFAIHYNRGEDVAANTILISTAASVITISLWLLVLGV